MTAGQRGEPRSDVAVAPVTVAITTLDRPDALDRCLRSLAAGSVRPAEVIVVDQSPERTARPVVEAAGELTVEYHADGGGGLGRGQNRAVGMASQELVAVLDDDCVADERWVETVHELIADGLGLVGGRVLPLPDERPGLVPVSSRTSDELRDFRGPSEPWHLGSGNNFAFSLDAFQRIGGCDERLGPGTPGRGGVDMDLFYRMLRDGTRGRYDPRLLVYHEQKEQEGRRSRRCAYGFGMAAACALWLREGHDRHAVVIFGKWIGLRLRMLASGLRHANWTAAWEEVLVLAGTAAGTAHGLRIAGRDR
jgi:GT2 family glycosyltransferase